MSLGVDVARVEVPGRTSHDDLMDLASRWSYDTGLRRPGQPLGSPVWIEVNGKSFEVVDVVADPVTGLDAFVFRNAATREITVGFQGTADRTDLVQDAMLVPDGLVPPQYHAAAEYIEVVERDWGPVSHVCGNSLGGGLAAYVGLLRPDVLAVTVNPAPVPGPSLDGVRAEVDNVVNYIAPQDPLHRAVVAAGLGGRVVGERIPFPGTSDHVAALITNHVGSDRGDVARDPYDASMAVPFSLVRPDVVVGAGAFGTRVDIDVGNLSLVAGGLDRIRVDLAAVCSAYLVETEDDLRRYGTEIAEREAREHERFVEVGRDATAPVRDLLTEIQLVVEREVGGPLRRLPTPPPPLRPAWAVVGAVTAAWGEIAGLVRGIADFSSTTLGTAAWAATRGVVSAESLVLTDELADQCGLLAEDHRLVDHKSTAFAAAVRSVGDQVARVDETLAAAIASRRCPPDALPADLPPGPRATVPAREGRFAQSFTQAVVEVRQEVCGRALGMAVEGLVTLLRAGTGVQGDLLGAALEVLQAAVGGMRRGVDGAVTVLGVSGPGIALRLAGAWDEIDRFRDAVAEVAADVERGIDHAQDVLGDLGRAVGDVPDVVAEFAPELEESFCSDAVIERCYDDLLRCRNVLERSEVAFAEVCFQLGDHDARAIDALADRAAEVHRDLATLAGSVRAMVP